MDVHSRNLQQKAEKGKLTGSEATTRFPRASCFEKPMRSVPETWGHMCVCVCVCVSPPVERGYPLTRYRSQGEFTPPNACDVIPPPDSAHQPLPGEMLADGCPLGNVYGAATFSSRLLEYRPVRHSVTLRFHLGHLPFLPFQISEESDMRSQCNYVQKTPLLTQTKSSSECQWYEKWDEKSDSRAAKKGTKK
jgi:hypothetical protein